MTDTTDIAALRSLCKSVADCGYVHPVSVDGRLLESLLSQLDASSESEWKLAGDLVDAHNLLGSERQRADNWSVSFENERLRADKLAAHIEALKGDQVPVAWTDAEELRGIEKDGCGYLFKVDPANPFTDPRRQIMLYDRPQKPVVLPPLPVAIGEFTEVAMKAVRRLDIAAIEAAGGIVKDGA